MQARKNHIFLFSWQKVFLFGNIQYSFLQVISRAKVELIFAHHIPGINNHALYQLTERNSGPPQAHFMQYSLEPKQLVALAFIIEQSGKAGSIQLFRIWNLQLSLPYRPIPAVCYVADGINCDMYSLRAGSQTYTYVPRIPRVISVRYMFVRYSLSASGSLATPDLPC